MSAFSSLTLKDLLARLNELREQESTTRTTLLTIWTGLGEILSELRDRHLRGELGKGTWASYCSKRGYTKVEADRYIATYRAEDPAAYFAELIQQNEEKTERAKDKKESKFIIVKRPGVIFGYVSELDEPGKKELFALLWRNYGRLLRRVGDEVGGDFDDAPEVRLDA